MQNSDVMPQRILKPAWEGIKSPITLKSLLLFLAVGFIAYTVIRDERYIRASIEADRVAARHTEETRFALEDAKQYNEATDQNLRYTQEQLKVFVDVRNSMHNIAELLKINREAQAAEHRAIYNDNRKPRTTRRGGSRSLQPCYELRPVEKKYGNSSVVVNTLIETKCP